MSSSSLCTKQDIELVCTPTLRWRIPPLLSADVHREDAGGKHTMFLQEDELEDAGDERDGSSDEEGDEDEAPAAVQVADQRVELTYQV